MKRTITKRRGKTKQGARDASMHRGAGALSGSIAKFCRVLAVSAIAATLREQFDNTNARNAEALGNRFLCHVFHMIKPGDPRLEILVRRFRTGIGITPIIGHKCYPRGVAPRTKFGSMKGSASYACRQASLKP